MFFFNIIHERLIKFETFCIALSDVWPLYTHTCVKLINSYLEIVKFLFLFSIFSLISTLAIQNSVEADQLASMKSKIFSITLFSAFQRHNHMT